MNCMTLKLIPLALAVASGLIVSASEGAAAILRTGFDSATLGANDDGSSMAVDIGFETNFFGRTNNQLYVNNNGNVTFESALNTFTPFDLTATGRQIIAPFFADVDTRNYGSSVTYGRGAVGGYDAFGVNWSDVGFFGGTEGRATNSFQLVLIDRSATGLGNFDIEFNYGNIGWEAGTFSGGDSNGLGGDSARAGFSNGTGEAGTYYEIAGSAVNGAFVDGSVTALASSSNIGEPGRYLFSARNGAVGTAEITAPVPLPAAGWLLIAGLGGLAAMRRRNTRH
ncbi:autotransporter [Salipiger aestuarii]|nr:outer membrane autotransporter barrel domain protein [Citreicella sp. 357]KAA8610731.1 autotransporter [Salipiger aestuarii]